MQGLVNDAAVERWERAFAAGNDKQYPTLDLVRLERWFFEGRPGRLLEYGFGTGVNLLHLVERGYEVDAVDVAENARRLAEQKLERRPDLAHRARLHILPAGTRTLPFADATFDYVTCLSVLSLLGTKDSVALALAEFARVLKPGGKLIADINSANSDFARQAVPVDGDHYQNVGTGGDEPSVQMYCPSDSATFVELVAAHLDVVDVGYAAHAYLGSEIHEFILCAAKAGDAVVNDRR